VGQRATTTTNLFANFSPQVQSSLALNYTQPLLRGFHIDATRQQLLVNEKEPRDCRRAAPAIGDVDDPRRAQCVLGARLRESPRCRCNSSRSTWPTKRCATHARASKSAPLLPSTSSKRRPKWRSGRKRSFWAVANRNAQDTLRSLIFNTNDPNFWNVRIEPTELPQVTMVTVDTDALMRNALDKRTDLEQTKKTIEASDISIRFARNQTLPDVTASIDYGLTGLGGTRLIRDSTESSAAR
jgi:hypothetical protein